METAETVRHFDRSGGLRFVATEGGLTRAVISTPQADAEIFLHGAHVTNWMPRGERPVLFVSSRSLFEPGKAIRGGVPICFPWFGPRADGQAGPLHGYARIQEWTVEETKLLDDGRVEVVLGLSHDSFVLRFRITVGAYLEMELEVRNAGNDPVTFEEALHTYFAVGDIRRVSVSGLAGTTYVDKTDGFKRKVLGQDPLCIVKETDQVHVDTSAACQIDDAEWKRRITIEKRGSGATVVWNPWVEKNATIGDMAPDDWQRMICVETANAMEQAIRLAPGATHKMAAIIRVS